MTYALTESIEDLLDQDIRERGVNAMVLCPFHDEDTPSFSIHLEEGVWHCFGCGRKGNLEQLYHLLDKKMDSTLYLQRAIRNAVVEIRESPDFSWLANQQYESRKRGDGAASARAYLGQRSVEEDTLDAFMVGYDPDRKALSFPYLDRDGRVTGIKYRHYDGRKSAESGSVFGLYGFDFRGKDTVFCCEGESDTQAVYARVSGEDRIGVCGTSGSPRDVGRWNAFSLDLFFASRIYLCHDADDSGDAAADMASTVFGPRAIRVRPRKGKDLNEHFQAGGTLFELGVSDLHV